MKSFFAVLCSFSLLFSHAHTDNKNELTIDKHAVFFMEKVCFAQVDGIYYSDLAGTDEKYHANLDFSILRGV